MHSNHVTQYSEMEKNSAINVCNKQRVSEAGEFGLRFNPLYAIELYSDCIHPFEQG